MQGTLVPAHRLFVDGAWADASGAARTEVRDPSTNAVIATAAAANREDVSRAVDAAQAAFDGPWGALSASDRGKALRAWADALVRRRDVLCETETRNQGKVLREARVDIDSAIDTLVYHAGMADKIEGATIPVPGARFNYTVREPFGVTGHIAPWNYPFKLAMRSLAPALSAGNTAVLKPATLTPLTAIQMAEAAAEAGLPKGTLNVVTGGGSTAGDALVRHPRVAAIAFTGSVTTGIDVATAAAAKVIPTTLELGGKSPNIVFADADLGAALKGVVSGIFHNAGQMCRAGSRLLVEESIAEIFLSKVKEESERIALGPGLDPDSRMGPLVSPDQRSTVEGYIEAAKRDARLVTGGHRPAAPPLAGGNFLEPTVFDRVPRDSALAREEVFGPVLSVFTFRDEKEAVEIANDTTFGLWAGVWTRALSRAHRMAARIDAGMIAVNDFPPTFAQVPFGGFKQSGLSHEQGREAVYHYTRLKNVTVRLD